MNDILSQELDALKEIYPELNYQKSDFNDRISGFFKADIKLDHLHEVVIINRENSFSIKHLPSITLNFLLAENTEVVSFDIDCMWLSDILKNKITEKLNTIESDGGILWNCFQFLELESFDYLFNEDLKDIVEVDISNLNGSDNNELFDYLIKYDCDKAKSVFNESIMDCGSCMVSKRGRDCIVVRRCGDTFCLKCATAYFNTQIKGGDLHLRCLVCGGDVDYDEIQCVLDKESFDRWDQLVFNHFLKTNDVAKPCPRCTTLSPVEDHCGICPKCHYSFCSKCKGSYHADPDCQKVKKSMKKYKAMKLESQEKHETMRLCSTSFSQCPEPISTFPETALSETSTKSWTRKFGKSSRMPPHVLKLREKKEKRAIMELCDITKSSACPNCKEMFQKDGGCHIMKCAMCKTYFCYLCKKILPKDPHNHRTSDCIVNNKS